MTENQIKQLTTKINNKLLAACREYVKIGVRLNKAGAVATYKAILVEIKETQKVFAKLLKTKTAIHAAEAAGLHEEVCGVPEEHIDALHTLGFKKEALALVKVFNDTAKLADDFSKLYNGLETYETKVRAKVEATIAKQEAKAKAKAAKSKQTPTNGVAGGGTHAMVEGNRDEAHA